LRAAVKQGTPAGKSAKSYMDAGNLVPDAVLIDMFREKLHTPECARGFILDGFPRNLAQARSLDQLLEELDKKLSAVINIQVSDELLTERITGRRVCSNQSCATPFHVTFSPPQVDNQCDVCGSQLMTRSDDKLELVAKRLNTYQQETLPLIEYYDRQLLLRTIDGDGDPDEIFADILRTLQVLA
jgi:adenylate kinase